MSSNTLPSTGVSDNGSCNNGYRLNAGIVLINSERKVFIGKRISHCQIPPHLKNSTENSEGWQMPQGGIDPNETPYDAAVRELREEIGVTEISLIAESKMWYDYRFPVDLQPYLWDGRYHSQRQRWFLFRLHSGDDSINLNTTLPPEFSEWQWSSAAVVLSLIVGFKRDVYSKVLAEFEQFLC